MKLFHIHCWHKLDITITDYLKKTEFYRCGKSKGIKNIIISLNNKCCNCNKYKGKCYPCVLPWFIESIWGFRCNECKVCKKAIIDRPELEHYRKNHPFEYSVLTKGKHE